MTENTVLGAWIQWDLVFLFYLLTNVTLPKNHKLWHRDTFQNTCVCLTHTNVEVINLHTLCYLASIWSWLSWFETVANKLPRSRSLTRVLWRRLTAVNRPNGTETEKMAAIDVPLPHWNTVNMGDILQMIFINTILWMEIIMLFQITLMCIPKGQWSQ